jgi:peptidoglycan/LPS O-acetylase OafA/YrhL
MPSQQRRPPTTYPFLPLVGLSYYCKEQALQQLKTSNSSAQTVEALLTKAVGLQPIQVRLFASITGHFTSSSILNSTQNASRQAINYHIEALRGFAAIFVVWHHAIVYTYLLDPGFKPSGLFAYAPPGHFCVLIFFVLSGYVIGLSNKKPLTWATSGEYLKKRLLRLYPIYLVVLLFTWLVNPQQLNTAAVLGNLALLQGLWVNEVNLPSWSLNYEMLYYSLFIFISIFQWKYWQVGALALVLAVGNLALYPVLDAPIMTSYCLGLIFWVLGLGLSQYLAARQPHPPTYQLLLGCVLFLLCIEQYNPFATLLHKLLETVGLSVTFPTSVSWARRAITVFDLSSIPFTLLIMLVVTGKKVPYKFLLLRLGWACASINLLYLVKHVYKGGQLSAAYMLPTFFFLASLLCVFVRSTWVERLGKWVMGVGSWLGSLSFALYLVHYPIMLLFGKIGKYSGTWQTFTLRFVLLLLLSIASSYLLEKVFQPRLREYFRSDLPVPALESVSRT